MAADTSKLTVASPPPHRDLVSIRTTLLNSVRRVFQNPVCEHAFARLLTGGPSSSALARMAPHHLLYEPGSVRRVVRWGATFDLDLSDLVSWTAFMGFRQAVLELLARETRPGMVCLDVGANIGTATLVMAGATGPHGVVVSLEPHPHNLDKLRTNLALNATPHVRVLPVAAGATEGEAVMVSPGLRNAGMNRIATHGESPALDIRVPVRPLDAIVAEENLPRVDLVKIDVEGFEMRVLEGARTLLDRCQPLIVCELADEYLRLQGSSAHEVVAFLRAADYHVRDVETGLPLEGTLQGIHTDLIARPTP